MAGVVCYGGVLLKGRFGYDDALDAFGVHGVGGALGALLTGVFATKAFNPAGADGLLRGNGAIMLTQIVGVVAAAAFAVVLSYAILYAIDKTIGLRVTPDEEREGLDTALHGESGYELGSTGAGEAHYEAEEPEPARALVTLVR